MKTSELSGPALDLAVAKCLGYAFFNNALLDGRKKEGWWLSGIYPDPNDWVPISACTPSTHWAQAGPIIEREKIQVSPHQSEDGQWEACKLGAWPENYFQFGYFGPTPLIAVMRCFVASKLGDDVEIPEELK